MSLLLLNPNYLANSEYFSGLLPPTFSAPLMPVALNTVSPPDSDSFKPRRLPVSDDIVAPVVVDLVPGIGFGVPALDTHDHVLNTGTEN